MSALLSRRAERDAEPLAVVARGLGIDRAERAAHGGGGGEAVGLGVGAIEFGEGDDVDRIDEEPSDAGREGALARADLRAEPAADRRALGAGQDGLVETFFEMELAHVAEES